MSAKTQWLRLSAENNAIDYLDKSYHFLRQTDCDEVAWKWVVLSLHGALYGFAICALQGTNPHRVLKQKRTVTESLSVIPQEIKKNGFPEDIKIEYKKGRLIYNGVMTISEANLLLGLSKDDLYQKAIDSLFHKTYSLISLPEALRRCKNPGAFQMGIGCQCLRLSETEDKDIELFYSTFRNNFEHYMPRLWLIELHGFPRIILSVLKAVRFLALDSGYQYRLTRREVRKIKSIIFHSRRFIKNNTLHRESVALA